VLNPIIVNGRERKKKGLPAASCRESQVAKEAGVLVYGFINSVILAMIALGFSITFGISRVANFSTAVSTSWAAYSRGTFS
jgi:hypothetical protein